MRVWVAIAVGGALGALSRWFVGTLMGSLDAAGNGFPWGTLTANVVGCALIGFLAPLLAKQAAWLVGFTITGFLGGFTTYSAFAEETFILLDRGDATGVMLAGAYVMVTIIAAAAAVVVGTRFFALAFRPAAGER